MSSAGLERQLKRPEHFTKSLGKQVLVKLYTARNGVREYIGTLTGYDSGRITLDTSNGPEAFEKNEVALARLYVEF